MKLLFSSGSFNNKLRGFNVGLGSRNKSNRLNFLIAVFITVAIIIGLVVFSPTASAIEVSVSGVSSSYTVGDTDTFKIRIDIDEGERIPMDNITATIEKSSSVVDDMTFTIDGTVIESGNYLVSVSRTGYDVGYGYGYRYGYDVETGENVQFGYGYGYGYGYGTATGVLEYKVTLDTSGMSTGSYDLYATLNSSDGGTVHTYKSNTVSFSVESAPSPGPGPTPTPGPGPGLNDPPDVKPGGPYSVMEQDSIQLDGSESADPEGTELSFSWAIVDDPTGEASLTGASTAKPEFYAPIVDEDMIVTVELTCEDEDGASASENTTVTVINRKKAPLSEIIENMTPENAAENLAASDFESAARVMDNLDPNFAGEIIDAAISRGLCRNMGKIINLMETSKAVAARHSAKLSSATAITKCMVEDDLLRASEIVDAGAKMDLSIESGIISGLDAETAANILMRVYDLPETPQAAADLLSNMEIESSTGVIRYLIDQDSSTYVDGIFSHLDISSLNMIYERLSIYERGVVWPQLSPNVQEKVFEDLAPRFELSGLELSKTEVNPGETIEIMATVKNTGGTPHSYTVRLLIGGVEEYQETVSLDPGGSQQIFYEVTKTEPGTYQVEMEDLTESFVVRDKVEPSEGLPLGLIYGVIVAIIAVAIVAIVWWRRSEKSWSIDFREEER